MLAAMTWGQWAFAALLTFVCFLLMVVILLQKGRGGGLAGAFGGAGGTSAFGAKTGDVFTWITVVVAGVFVLLTVVGNFAFDQSAKPAAPMKAEIQPLPGGEGEEAPAGAQPVQRMPMKAVTTTDPVTGETTTSLVPADWPAADESPPAPPPAGQGDAKTPQPEGSPGDKKDEKDPSHP